MVGVASPHVAIGQRTVHRALTASDIDDIARLEMMEDRRQVDTLNVSEVTRLLAAEHAEVRRRAAITVGRLADVRGIPLLLAHPLDPDTAIAASVVWAIGQIRSPNSVIWLDSILTSSKTPPTVAAEAAIALGKIVAPTARGSLEQFLTNASLNTRTRAAIGEALLSIGRFTKRGDIAPIIKWATSSDDEIRWSATWALARLRDPAGVPILIARASAGDKSLAGSAHGRCAGWRGRRRTLLALRRRRRRCYWRRRATRIGQCARRRCVLLSRATMIRRLSACWSRHSSLPTAGSR